MWFERNEAEFVLFFPVLYIDASHMIFTWIYGLTFILKFCVCVNVCISINLCILFSHVLVHYLKSLTLLLFYGMLNLALRENSFFFFLYSFLPFPGCTFWPF